MADKSFKHFYDDGYTTYHDNGGKSQTYPHLFDDGFTTYHDDGSKSTSYKNVMNEGYTTYHYPSNLSYESSIEQDSNTNQPNKRYSYTPCGYSHVLTTGRIVFAYAILFLIAFLSYVYAGITSVFLSFIFAIVVTVDVIRVKNGNEERQEIWSQIINLTMTAYFIAIVDSITKAPKSWLVAIIFYLLPLAIIILCVCLNNTINNEDDFTIAYVFVMAISWFCRVIYKKNYPSIYSTIVTVETIVLVLLFLIFLAIIIYSQKKSKH